VKRLSIGLVFALAACGGGSGGAQPSPVTASAGAPAGTADVRVIVAVPRGTSAHARAPQYVSPGTASVSVTVAGITASAACASPATTCTVDVAAPVGSDTFAISLADGSGTVLSSGSTTATIAANVLNTIGVTFDGVVGSLDLTLSSPTLDPGSGATDTLTIHALDPDGYTIVQPGNYLQPIVITASPSLPAALSFGGPTTITAIPATTPTVAVHYTGALATGSYTFTATSGSVTGTATLTIPVPGGVSASPNFVQFTTVPGSANVDVSETNYAGTFSFADSPAGSCTGIVTIGTFAGGLLPLTSTGVGACTVTASDTLGGSATITVHVGTTTLVGS
jgi:hypothetical protein